MIPIRKKVCAFTLLELVVVLVIIGVLAILAVPVLHDRMSQGQMTGLLNNARQFHLAAATMSLDTFNAGGDGLEWTSVPQKGKAPRPASLAEFFGALTKNNYLSKSDLKKLLTAPGKGPGPNDPTAENICFRFFQVEEKSPADQPFIVTANWRDKQLTDEAPYGKKGFVIFTKSGSGGIFRRANDVSSAALFPTKTVEGCAPYHYDTLK